MGDLISRKAVIDIIHKKTQSTEIWLEYDALIDVEFEVDELPSAQQWIPCSERLPNKYCHCLVTRRNDYEDGSFDTDVREDTYIELEGIWGWRSKFEGLIDNIIAWMPLPEPYKGE